MANNSCRRMVSLVAHVPWISLFTSPRWHNSLLPRRGCHDRSPRLFCSSPGGCRCRDAAGTVDLVIPTVSHALLTAMHSICTQKKSTKRPGWDRWVGAQSVPPQMMTSNHPVASAVAYTVIFPWLDQGSDDCKRNVMN